MSSLRPAIFIKIEACMREWHPRYEAAVAIFLEIADYFAYQNSPDTQAWSAAAESPRRCQQCHGQVHGVGELPLEYVIHMPVNPNISKK